MTEIGRIDIPILIVDDRPEKLTALSAIFDGMNLTIIQAHSGEEALSQLLQREFAVVLLDVNMPTMDGFETAKLIRSRQSSEHLPIIFVTAERLEHSEELAGYQLGAVDYIFSPVLPEILRAKVSVFANLYQLRKKESLYAQTIAANNTLLAEQNQLLKEAEERIRRSESQFRSVFESTHDAVMMLDEKGFFDCNNAALELFGCPSHEQFCSYHPADLSPLTQPCGTNSMILANQRIATALERGTLHFEWLHKRIDTGALFFAEVLLNALTLDGKRILHATVYDNSERKEIVRRLEESHSKNTALLNSMAEGAYGTDAQGCCVFVNHSFLKILGYEAEDEVIGQHIHELIHHSHADGSPYPSDDCKMYNAYRQQKNIHVTDEVFWRKDGVAVPVEYWSQLLIVNGICTGSITTFSDVTERRKQEKEIKQLAFYDALTGLPNRRQLLDHMNYLIKLSYREGKRFAVFMMDLDKFKAVNDTFGHAGGDDLLKQVAARVTARLRESDIVARLGGDEFVIVLENCQAQEYAEKVATEVIADLTEPFELADGNVVQIGASIGISFYPQHGTTPESLIDAADGALYQAKEHGRGCFKMFN